MKLASFLPSQREEYLGGIKKTIKSKVEPLITGIDAQLGEKIKIYNQSMENSIVQMYENYYFLKKSKLFYPSSVFEGCKKIKKLILTYNNLLTMNNIKKENLIDPNTYLDSEEIKMVLGGLTLEEYLKREYEKNEPNLTESDKNKKLVVEYNKKVSLEINTYRKEIFMLSKKDINFYDDKEKRNYISEPVKNQIETYKSLKSKGLKNLKNPVELLLQNLSDYELEYLIKNYSSWLRSINGGEILKRNGFSVFFEELKGGKFNKTEAPQVFLKYVKYIEEDFGKFEELKNFLITQPTTGCNKANNKNIKGKHKKIGK